MRRPSYAASAPGSDGTAPRPPLLTPVRAPGSDDTAPMPPLLTPAPAPGSGGAAPIPPLPTPAPEASSHLPNHGGNGDNRRPAPPQEQNGDAGHHGPPPAPDRETQGDGSLPHRAQQILAELARDEVICSGVQRSEPIWSCSTCFNILHLSCIRTWASSSATGNTRSWDCPGCKSKYTCDDDLTYTCFCGRQRDPVNDHIVTPHSCGKPCSRPLERAEPSGTKWEWEDAGAATRCLHICQNQCHPGPCPPCSALVQGRPCFCGRQTMRRCGDRSTPLTCGNPCEKMLPCKRHRCKKVCHTGSCGDCEDTFSARCFCGKKRKELLCKKWLVNGELSEKDGMLSCTEICGCILACGNHACKDICHPGSCGECELMPGKVTTCLCGKTTMGEKRGSCLDAIPTCDKICEKKLPCGVHPCKEKCHEGECPPCMVRIDKKCCCGSTSQMFRCCYAISMKVFHCNKLCGKEKNCGRHLCSELCCAPYGESAWPEGGKWDPHICQIPCGKKLLCGKHSCQLKCHSGCCPPCLENILTELSCPCGETVLPPPQPCGTPAPSCSHQCSIPQPCGHAALEFSNLDALHFGDDSSSSSDSGDVDIDDFFA